MASRQMVAMHSHEFFRVRGRGLEEGDSPCCFHRLKPPRVEALREATFWPLAAIDDCTRLWVLCAYPNHDQQTAIRFIDHILSKLPFQVEKVHTDNGKEFGQIFYWYLLDKGIGHVCIAPAIPRLNGKVERYRGALTGSAPYERLKQKTRDPLS